MSSARQDLVDELVVERFGPPRLRRPGTPSTAFDRDPAVLAERQWALCAAMDGVHLAALAPGEQRPGGVAA
jgi:hypothetical protein